MLCNVSLFLCLPTCFVSIVRIVVHFVLFHNCDHVGHDGALEVVSARCFRVAHGRERDFCRLILSSDVFGRGLRAH